MNGSEPIRNLLPLLRGDKQLDFRVSRGLCGWLCRRRLRRKSDASAEEKVQRAEDTPLRCARERGEDGVVGWQGSLGRRRLRHDEQGPVVGGFPFLLEGGAVLFQ